MRIAQLSAKKDGFGRPFFSGVCHSAGVWGAAALLCGHAVWAQEAVYRCGQEYTNAPQDKTHCVRVASQSVTVIEGTRPLGAIGRTTAGQGTLLVPEERTKSEPSRADPAQRERDTQARAIVAAELDKARQQQAQWLEEYNQGEPVKWASESRNHQKYLDRVAALKAALERNARDIDSLQRELTRRP